MNHKEKFDKPLNKEDFKQNLSYPLGKGILVIFNYCLTPKQISLKDTTNKNLINLNQAQICELINLIQKENFVIFGTSIINGD